MSGLRVDDEAAIVELRRVLDAAGYTIEGIPRALGLDGAFTRESAEIPYYVRILPRGAPISTLIKLFLLDVPVTRGEADTALAPLGVERIEAIGLVEAGGAGDEVRGLVDLVPREELLVASDRFHDDRLPERPDHVYGPTPPTRALASLTVRRPVETGLDLGTGSGIQAILAAAHAGQVVGTDVNPRALEFARFNAVLNGVGNVELREGDLFEPVAGERFDLVVCNPPYLIAPSEGFAFRDSGIRGDRFCAELVRRVPEHLTDGGLAHVLVSWTPTPGEDWTAEPRRWVDGSGCDAILLRYLSFSPLGHAAQWNRTLVPDPDAYGAALDGWVEWYGEQGIHEIAWGAVVLRRREGRNWVWAGSPPGERVTRADHHVLRILATQDFLAAEPDLLGTRLATADDAHLALTFHLGEAGGAVDRALLRLDGGLAFEVGVDEPTIDLLRALDGRRRVGDVAGPEALPVVRRLLELGFAVPA
jgi:SAM-dependent methyltransferase